MKNILHALVEPFSFILFCYLPKDCARNSEQALLRYMTFMAMFWLFFLLTVFPPPASIALAFGKLLGTALSWLYCYGTTLLVSNLLGKTLVNCLSSLFSGSFSALRREKSLCARIHGALQLLLEDTLLDAVSKDLLSCYSGCHPRRHARGGSQPSSPAGQEALSSASLKPNNSQRQQNPFYGHMWSGGGADVPSCAGQASPQETNSHQPKWSQPRQPGPHGL